MVQLCMFYLPHQTQVQVNKNIKTTKNILVLLGLKNEKEVSIAQVK